MSYVREEAERLRRASKTVGFQREIKSDRDLIDATGHRLDERARELDEILLRRILVSVLVKLESAPDEIEAAADEMLRSGQKYKNDALLLERIVDNWTALMDRLPDPDAPKKA